MFKLGPGHINWSLVIGAMVVICVVAVAVFGRQLAPHDPLEEVRIIQVGDGWVTPPFPAFRVASYPLGSDLFGRDLLSRLLYGIRPTLVMVATVAGVRLFLGIVVGLLSGWYENWFGRWLTTLTSTVMSIPVLIVALVAIAAIGVEFGIWAFVAGLCVTGWAETAQVIREKTRAVKREQFVEAGHSLGATHVQILFAHVLRHVMPMVWMLFSFEISNTLMVTASLGFLGYFIGGDVWIEIGDFVARRISGSPELGQMLATSYTSILEPWGMFAVGSVIFVTVLGFNLAGEGLRRRLAYQRDVEQSIYGYILSKIVPYIRKKVTRPALSWSHAHPVLTSVLLLAILALVAPLIVWRVRAVAEVKIEMDMPEHVWASEWHDPYGSMHTTVTGPINPELLWVYETQDKIKGGVAVNREGILYFGDNSGILYAVDSDGRTIWETTLPHPIVGSPALGAASSIYVSDEQATLYAITPKGELLWSYSPEIQRTPTNGPVIGNDGTIYSGFGSNLMAVNPKGELIWHLPLPYDQYQNPPRLSVDGQWIFHDKVVVDSASGSLNEWPTMDDMDIALTGLDGKHYARAGNLVMVWESLLDDIAIVQSAKWDSSAFTFINPRCSGITEEGIIWMAYLAQRNPVVVWMNIEGNVMNTAAGERIERPVLIGLDGNDTAYLCGHKPAGTAVCNALVRDSHSPLWSVELVPEEENQVKGGAIAPGRLYVTLYDGYVVALGED